MGDNRNSTSYFRQGLKDGFPICLGYLSVSFAFGITVVGSGFSPWVAVLISITNLTSAGQLAGLTVMAAGGGMIEMALTQLVINLRYALMSFSLTQKLSEKFRLVDRFLVSFVITDEIFAVAASQKQEVQRSYMAGLALTPILGWTSGTWLGSVASGLLPSGVVSALGIAIYGMFIAIVIPEIRKFRPVLIVVLIAVALSCLFHFCPWFDRMSSGFIIIISSVAASFAGAVLYPLKQEEMDHE